MDSARSTGCSRKPNGAACSRSSAMESRAVTSCARSRTRNDDAMRAIVRTPQQSMRGGRHLMPSTTATHAGTCRLWLVGVLLHALAGAAAAEPALTVATGGRTAIYTVAGLLGLPAATTVTIPADVAYKRSMIFRAIPFATLLDGVESDDNVGFVADYGFA